MIDDLFTIEETPTPERQWRSLCEAAGVELAPHGDNLVARISGFTGYPQPDYVEAIHSLHRVIAKSATPIFPTFAQWKLYQRDREK